MNREEAQEVLKKITDLCVGYDVQIGGCGCCESPWLVYEDSSVLRILEIPYKSKGLAAFDEDEEA
jgi:hypothetical protein